MVQFPPVRHDVFRLEGGLDLVTPTLALKPGVARDAVNFEVSVTGGYTRISGYERFDGRPAPSAAIYLTMTLDTVAGVAVGDTITDAPAVKTGVVIAISGETLVYTKAVGSFVSGDTIKVGAATIGTVQPASAIAFSSLALATYTGLAADNYRADIGVVPGSGPVRGVVHFNGVVYAWRNNAGGTAMAIYKSSASGWQAVALGHELSFNTGVDTAWAEGATVYGNTSGATGVVSRVVLSSGATWVGGSGRLILSSTTGTFQNGEALKLTNGAGVTKATCAGAAAAITLAPDGRVQTVQGTFGSGIATRVYGADGVNRGFEFDGTVYVPISTGMSVDKPTSVALHKSYLFFAFGSSVQNSGISTPYVWSPVFGANELVLPESVTAMLTLPGTVSSGALAIFTRNNTFLLYGTGMSSWNLVPFNTGVGASAYTTKVMESAYALDDRGVVTMQASQNYGNFDSATLTLAIRPFIQARRSLATASGLNREKSQYRVFYSDGYGLYITVVNGKVLGSMPVLFSDPVFCWAEGETADGAEVSYYGGSLGYVYKLDSGTSFDGGLIGAHVTLNYNPQGAARILKRYRAGSLEVTGSGYADFTFGYSLGYGSTDVDQPASVAHTVPFVAAAWDSFVWDSFVWDGRSLLPSEVAVAGTAENIAVTIASSSKISHPWTVNSVILHYSPRRGIR